MAISHRSPFTSGTAIHFDHGVQPRLKGVHPPGAGVRARPFHGRSVGDCYDCETGVRRPVGLTRAYDWPSRCPGVDLSAARATPPQVAHRAGSDLIGA
jgi:putative transposase